jgi:hypothetical protein
MASEPAYNKRPPNPKELCISAADLCGRYLFGVDLTNDNGEGYLTKNIEFNIRKAQLWLQKEIPGLLLFPTQIKSETHDYYLNDYVAYNFIKLFRYPVQSVERVAIQFPLATQTLTFDPSWYRVDSNGAQCQLVPTQGTFSSIVLGQGGNFLPLFYSGLQQVPALWQIDYTAGFAKGQIPEDILDIIGLKASIMPMNIAGDLIAGAGVASKNISLDGLSQGIVTTASAENTGYTANIKQREKEITSMLKGLKEFYTGIQFAVM